MHGRDNGHNANNRDPAVDVGFKQRCWSWLCSSATIDPKGQTETPKGGNNINTQKLGRSGGVVLLVLE
jgi:hypothetical protein